MTAPELRLEGPTSHIRVSMDGEAAGLRFEEGDLLVLAPASRVDGLVVIVSFAGDDDDVLTHRRPRLVERSNGLLHGVDLSKWGSLGDVVGAVRGPWWLDLDTLAEGQL